ncbi:SMI1/KNR4 family protein [Dactylosporangium aurantiacum]|uniref:SMI1/KNR4 family protein n=1 Tax=Dactylosporangium aurantiacum TaxID=35754 RepID=A0A9Q9MIQ3_9ACTN|nr:SMI1/KNR4 family protein [Dactylosporangium aurantiacum]MDG6107329.1 SMI1/KNR4 family protein [Dactylosporangium aurantiacum]UWZ51147.1 SMI1/KNR4 family protein [Dactylosporangium aurantiacum]
MDEQRVVAWRASIEAATARALRDVVSTFPFEPGAQEVGPPASAAQLAQLRARMPWIPGDLLAVCGLVGAVSLPDIANGYLMFDPEYMLGVRHRDDGLPDRIGAPFDEDVVVFGSDGGGALYAVTLDQAGTVHRLRECRYEAGTYSFDAVGTSYDTSHVGITPVAESLDDFLDKLLNAVEAFAVDGSIADL